MSDIVGTTVAEFRKNILIRGNDPKRRKILTGKKATPLICLRYGSKDNRKRYIPADDLTKSLYDDMIIIEDLGGNKKKHIYSIIVDELQ